MFLGEGGKIHTLKHQKKKKNLSFHLLRIKIKLEKCKQRGGKLNM